MTPQKTFVFTDIHGCANELKLLLNKIPLEPDSTLIFLGDYVDRGEKSKEVINIILELKKTHHVVALKGNHEDMFQGFLKDPSSEKAALFIYNGGSSTLASYGDDNGELHIPDEHIDFINNLALFHEDDQYFYVHAGLPDVPLEEIRKGGHQETLLWIRDRFFKSKFDWGKTIVHGHTPVKDVFLSPKRINIDTGCVYENRLSALELPSKRVYSVTINRKLKQVFLRKTDSVRRSIRFNGSAHIYIYVDDQMFEFETVNYSAVGMYVRDIIHSDRQILQLNQTVKGDVGRNNQDTISFEGQIVRIDQKDGSYFYAINMTKTPFEFLANPWGP